MDHRIAILSALLLYALAELLFYLYIKFVVYPQISVLRRAPKPALDPTIFIERVLQHIVCLKNYSSEAFFAGDDLIHHVGLLY